jgi:hypothetical protein
LGEAFFPLDVGPQAALPTFAVSFEVAAAALAELPRMYVEPDGAFVWTPADTTPACRMEGVMYDRAGRLLYVDVAGECPPASFDGFLAALGWPATPLVFQLVREAVFLDEPSFRRHAELTAGLTAAQARAAD